MTARPIDISPPIDASLAVFPGDTSLQRTVLMDIARGDPITLSTLRSTVHLGSHADAPSHYAADGMTIESLPLEHHLGQCVVIDAHASRGHARCGVLHVAGREGRLGDLALVTRPIVLLRTLSQPDKRVFNEDFVGLEPALVEELASRGVITIGVDTPSVDTATSKDLPAHAACARHGIAIIEGLVLDHVRPGTYELIALPLKLVGFDASPVRAVLRPVRPE